MILQTDLVNGQNYEIIVACVNTGGVTCSEPESATAALEPPQPEITRVKAGNREILVHFKCPGYDRPKVKAWFEVELNPSKPPLIIHQAQTEAKKESNDETKSPEIGSPTDLILIAPDLMAGLPITPPSALALAHEAQMSSPSGNRVGLGSMSSSVVSIGGSIGGN